MNKRIKTMISIIVFVGMLLGIISFVQGAPAPNSITPVLPIIISSGTSHSDKHQTVVDVVYDVSDDIKVKEIQYLISEYDISFFSYDDAEQQINLFLSNDSIHRYIFKDKNKYELCKFQVQQQYEKDKRNNHILKITIAIIFAAMIIVLFLIVLNPFMW